MLLKNTDGYLDAKCGMLNFENNLKCKKKQKYNNNGFDFKYNYTNLTFTFVI